VIRVHRMRGGIPNSFQAGQLSAILLLGFFLVAAAYTWC
jgi:hypothetical protein